MPELPEVENIRRDLEKIVVGKKITEVCVHNPVVIREPGLTEFKKEIEGVSIKRVLRRAKMLIFELSNKKALTVHLKMTGQLVYPGSAKSSRVSFHLSNGKSVDFNDQRLFGELRLVDDWHALKFIRQLGPEPQDLTLAQFKEMLGNKKTKIKTLLMDQTFISGIGNIYAAEILFRSHISPERSAAKLSEAEKELLFKAINDILNKAIAAGGSSVDDYVRPSGEQGNFSKYHKVYGRQGKRCLSCNGLIHRITQGGRGTFFCPHCQK
jgi:formamidopyrimidine-DNA glycosylase